MDTFVSSLYPFLFEQQQLAVLDDKVAVLKLAPKQFGAFLATLQQATFGALSFST